MAKGNKYDLTNEYGIGYTNRGNDIFYFDLDDYDLIKEYTWYLNGRGYVCAHQYGTGKEMRMHRFLTKAPQDKQVDHINHNKTDNRRSNLRLVTSSQNNMNRRKQSNSTSGVTGISYYKRYDSWEAKIQINGKQIYLGRYKDKEDAIKARKEAEIKYFGEYCYDGL